MKKYKFESKGFFTKNDKEALVESLEKSELKEGEKRVICHHKTRLEVEQINNSYKVQKSVNGGENYLYSSYFIILN